MSTRPGFRYALAVAISIASGAMVALQSRINGQFGLALGDGSTAALISFASGLVILTIAMAVSPGARTGFARIRSEFREGRLPWWAVTGGAGGAFLVLSQGLAAGILGVALFSIAVVTGQTVGAILIDARGWFGAIRVRVSALRLVGTILTLVGAILALDVLSGSLDGVQVLFVLPVLAGLVTGYQQAVNGRLKRLSGSAVAATFVNFAVGTTTLAIVTVAFLPFTGGPTALPEQWWLWTGGAIGTVFIAIQASTVGIIGVLGMGVSLVTGQLIGSIALDLVIPVATSDVHPITIVGALITLLGSIVVTLGRRPTTRG